MLKVRYFFRQFQRNFAGHAHWQNVKRRKEGRDEGRAILLAKFTNEIKTATRIGGSNIPQNNFLLASVLRRAAKSSVPKAVISKALEDKDNGDFEKLIFELSGSDGSMIIVDMVSCHPKRSKVDLYTLISKMPCTIGPKGSLMFNFTELGMVTLACDVSQEEELLECVDDLASDIEFPTEEKAEAKTYCAPSKLKKLVDLVESGGFEVIEQKTVRHPINTVDLTEESTIWFEKLMGGLFDHTGVIDVATNIKSY